MLKNIKNIFYNKQKAINEEIALKSKLEFFLNNFIKIDILKNKNIEYKLSYSIKNGIIKIVTDNKILDQEIALRLRIIEERLRGEGINFRKLLI